MDEVEGSLEKKVQKEEEMVASRMIEVKSRI